MKRHFMVKHKRLRVAWLFALATMVAIIVLHFRTGLAMVISMSEKTRWNSTLKVCILIEAKSSPANSFSARNRPDTTGQNRDIRQGHP